MPSSYPENIPKIIQMIGKHKPASILDIGFGRGKYGFLCKEYFQNTIGDWDFLKRIDGLEIFSEYITPLQRLCYDKIHEIDALAVKEYPTYDMYLIIDVLEHWHKEEGHKLLKHLLTKGKVLVSTPTNIGEQGAVHGNELERHVAQWLPKDFTEYKRIEDWSNESSFIYLLCA